MDKVVSFTTNRPKRLLDPEFIALFCILGILGPICSNLILYSKVSSLGIPHSILSIFLVTLTYIIFSRAPSILFETENLERLTLPLNIVFIVSIMGVYYIANFFLPFLDKMCTNGIFCFGRLCCTFKNRGKMRFLIDKNAFSQTRSKMGLPLVILTSLLILSKSVFHTTQHLILKDIEQDIGADIFAAANDGSLNEEKISTYLQSQEEVVGWTFASAILADILKSAGKEDITAEASSNNFNLFAL